MFHRLIAAAIGFLLPSIAHSAGYQLFQSGWNCQGFLYCPPGGGPPPADAVVILTSTVVSGVLLFISALAVVVFIYGALRMVVSQGQEGKEAGKKALIWASFGLAAALLTAAIIEFVTGYIYFLGT